jgi:2-methylcitrate dehydratase PrpD
MRELQLDFHLKNNLFKYHAACYLTHGAIEAALAIRETHGIDPASIRAITISVPPITDRVCNIARPSTGLEAKFSLRLTVAMALAGRDTSGIATYTDELTREPGLIRLRDLATIEFVDGYPQAKADIAVTLDDGRSFKATHDAGLPDADLSRQGRKLEQKFDAMVKPLLGARSARLREFLSGFGGGSGVAEISELARSPQ